jgi:hypothetical protein
MAAHRLRGDPLTTALRGALVMVLGALSTTWGLPASTGTAVPVPSNFTAQHQALELATPTTQPPPTTVSLPITDEPTPAPSTSRRASVRVKVAKSPGGRSGIGTTTSLSSERTTSRSASTTTSSAPRKTTAPPSTSPTTTTSTASCSSRDIQGGAVPWVATAASYIADQTGFSGQMLGIASRPNNPTSDHPHGYAIDFMVGADRSEGDRLARYVQEHGDKLGVAYVLWRVPDHFDHVHVSFGRTAVDTATFRC